VRWIFQNSEPALALNLKYLETLQRRLSSDWNQNQPQIILLEKFKVLISGTYFV
jgi:hypothetical protein